MTAARRQTSPNGDAARLGTPMGVWLKIRSLGNDHMPFIGEIRHYNLRCRASAGAMSRLRTRSGAQETRVRLVHRF